MATLRCRCWWAIADGRHRLLIFIDAIDAALMLPCHDAIWLPRRFRRWPLRPDHFSTLPLRWCWCHTLPCRWLLPLLIFSPMSPNVSISFITRLHWLFIFALCFSDAIAITMLYLPDATDAFIFWYAAYCLHTLFHCRHYAIDTLHAAESLMRLLMLPWCHAAWCRHLMPLMPMPTCRCLPLVIAILPATCDGCLRLAAPLPRHYVYYNIGFLLIPCYHCITPLLMLMVIWLIFICMLSLLILLTLFIISFQFWFTDYALLSSFLSQYATSSLISFHADFIFRSSLICHYRLRCRPLFTDHYHIISSSSFVQYCYVSSLSLICFHYYYVTWSFVFHWCFSGDIITPRHITVLDAMPLFHYRWLSLSDINIWLFISPFSMVDIIVLLLPFLHWCRWCRFISFSFHAFLPFHASFIIGYHFACRWWD